MNKLAYHLGGMTVMLLAFSVAARVLVTVVRSQSFGRAAWQLPTAGAVLMASPLLGLLCFELVSGRALGMGFSVFSRTEMPRQYWRCVLFHFAFLFPIAAATCAFVFSKR